jgi:hypothetical protein
MLGHLPSGATVGETPGPMAMAFERAGWVNFERTINMTW